MVALPWSLRCRTGRDEDYLDRRRPLPDETIAYVAELLPLIQGGDADSAVLTASVSRLIESNASLFVRRSDGAQAAENMASDRSSRDSLPAPEDATYRQSAAVQGPFLCAFGVRTDTMNVRKQPRLKPKAPSSCLGALQRRLAQMSKYERVDRRDARQPTERRPDKRAQGAPRSVRCFCFRFLPIRQCAAAACNVRVNIKSLPSLRFPQSVEAVEVVSPEVV